MRYLLIFLLTLICANAEERIQSYDSEIRVGKDGWLNVTETILVNVEGVDIRRGVYRDFPQQYRTRLGFRQNRPMEITEVTRNGADEIFRTEEMGSGTRIWIGDPDIVLEPGTLQTYQLKYRTDGQLFFDEKGDELYWNVTGNYWIFPIEKATARVSLPREINVRSAEAFTGGFGEKGRDYEVLLEGNEAVITTTARLSSHEGLTIVARWEKNGLDPTAYRKASLWASNKALLTGLFLMAIGTGVFLFCWLHIGRDPRRGLIIPRWEPPEGFSPAGVRFVKTMDFDDICFSAAVIGLAAKGSAKIRQHDASTYNLVKRSRPESLLPEEEILYEKLFSEGSPLLLHQVNHELIGKARSKLLDSLNSAYSESLFKNNTGAWLIALVVCMSGVFLTALQAETFPPALFAMIAGLVASWALIQCLKRLIDLPAKSFSWPLVKALVPFGVILMIQIGILWFFMTQAGLIAALAFGLVQALAVIFKHLMKSPTAHGRRILDEIDGFRDYLTVAEENRMNLENPPEKTPQLFEKFLPFALALGVEQQWSEKFAEVLAKITPEGDQGYSPSFYTGSSSGFGNALNGAALATAVTGALATSSVAPSTSGSSGGGGGGGGFSGGGGGGGGGGGW